MATSPTGTLNQSLKENQWETCSCQLQIFFTANIFASVSRLASCLNLQFISESVFYDTQQGFLFPVLNQA